MPRWTPDPTFYPSPRLAAGAPAEKFAYVALLEPDQTSRPDALGVIDLEPGSRSYGSIVSTLEMASPGDELHHFGWNACSAALCPSSPRPHVERRYLIVPGLRSSRVHVIDTKPDPLRPTIARTIEPKELIERTGYSRPHTTHCGPDAIYMSALGGANGPDDGGGLFLLDCESFDPLGAWEVDRGPQKFAYDFWWHLGHDTLLTSEWGSPSMFEQGVVPEKLLGREYGHSMHVWDLRHRTHLHALDLGDEHQMVLELRPAHDPRKTYGFVGVVVSVEDLSASIWLWYRDAGEWKIQKAITIPAEPADPELLPPLLKGFGAVPPLVTDINLSLDDRFLYVSCWGTGDCAGLAPGRRGAHRRAADGRGEPRRPPRLRVQLAVLVVGQAVLSGRPRGLGGQARRYPGRRPHSRPRLPRDRVRRPPAPPGAHLQGGDASSDSYCFP